MAKSPDRPHAPKGRDPAKHSKKDPAKPTRSKAARPDTPVLDPALADLLNPAIGQGRAGVGSQTGIEQNPSPSRTRAFPGSATVESPKSETSDLGVGEVDTCRLACMCRERGLLRKNSFSKSFFVCAD